MVECYCPNLSCDRPVNPVTAQFCCHCGTSLWLGDRYQLRRPLGSGRRVFWAVAGRSPEATPCVIERYALPAPVATGNLTGHPTANPTGHPTANPTGHPTANPTANLTGHPTANPTGNPTANLTGHPTASSPGPALLLREALALESLGQHPAIPRWLGQLSAHGCQFVVWEAIAGPTLAEELAQRGPFSLPQIREVAGQLLPVFHYLHQQGILHRNLSPAMVIRRQGSPGFGPAPVADHTLVLVGFGGMKLATATALAQPGTTTGIAAYAAPEQLMGQATFASDLYSLGVVLLHLLTGIHPFDLFSTTENRWVWRDFWDALDPSVANALAQSDVPKALDRLIAQGLRDRVPSAIAAWQDWFPGQTMPQLARSKPTAVASPPSAPTSPTPASPSSPATWHRVGTGSGHTGQITALGWLGDRTWVSASWDSTLRVWRSPDRAPTVAQPWSSLQSVQTVTSHSSAVTGIARSPDGRTLASISWDATLRLWQLDPQATASPLEPLAVGTGHRGWITAIAAVAALDPGSPSSLPQPLSQIAWITGGSDRTLRTWSSTGTLLTTVTGLAADPTAIAPTPEGQGCLWGDTTGQLYYAAFTPGSPIMPLRSTGADGAAGAIVGIQWLTSGQLLTPNASASQPVSNAASGLATSPTVSPVSSPRSSLASPPTLLVAWASGTWQRYAWTLAPPHPLKALAPASPPAHHPAGLTVLIRHANGHDWVTAGRDRTVMLWDGASGQPGDPLPQTAVPTAIAMAPQGRAIAVGTADQRIHLWQPSGTPQEPPRNP